MTAVDFYRVEWIDEAALVAAAIAAGWKEGDDGMLGFAPPENFYRRKDFAVYRKARSFALRARRQDIWRQARLYDCRFRSDCPGRHDLADCDPNPQIFEAGERKVVRDFQ